MHVKVNQRRAVPMLGRNGAGFFLSVALVIQGCRSIEANAGPDGAEAGGANGDAGPPTDAGTDALPCVADAEPHTQHWCSPQSAITQARTIIELSGNVTARCDSWTGQADSFVLPADPQSYPLLVHVSAENFAGPCSACPNPSATQFGIALTVPDSALFGPNGRSARLAVRVSAPWFVVSGGTGEPAAWPCSDGYQEYGLQACVQSYFSGFGLVTKQAHPPPADAWVQLEPGGDVTTCCPYRCP